MEILKKKVGGGASVGDYLDLILANATKGTGMCFYLLMTYASYIANAAYGIPVALAGVLITGTRIFDGITDPICSAIFDIINPKKGGKIRIFNIIGWAIAAFACLLMYDWAAGKFEGTTGVVVFVAIYVLYIIGYTMKTMAGSVVGIVITKDPKLRSAVSLTGTLWQYLTPMAFNTLVAFAILPRYGNEYNAPMLKEACYWYVVVALILLLISFIGLRKVDVPETYESLNKGKDGKAAKIGVKDMVSLLKGNRPMQMWVVTGASDKLAQQTASTSVVMVMLSGILIGNYKTTTMIGNFTMIASLVFVSIGTVCTARFGAKRVTRDWSLLGILTSAVMVVFCAILGPQGMSKISIAAVPTLIYIILQLLLTGMRMTLTTATAVMRADVVDYWMYRSGNYMPGTVSGVYSLIDKVISSLASTIAAVCVAMIGYTTVMPQMGDKVTVPLFWMTMFLAFGVPAGGWLCNVIAMKFYELDKERMVEVEAAIAERKAAAKAEKAAAGTKQ